MNIQNLVNFLLEAKEAYYNGNPIMTDAEFDEAEDKLRTADPTNEYFNIVGAEVKGSKINHSIRMRSMQKCNTVEHIDSWYNRNKYHNGTIMVGQLKLDGLSATLKYSDGKLQYMATRGDGLLGQDITRHANNVVGVNKRIKSTGSFEVRGELIIPRKSKLNTGESPLRNLASGLINRKESSEDIKEVTFVAYDIVGTHFSTEKGKELFLMDNDFLVEPFSYLHSKEEVIKWYGKIRVDRDKLIYEIDGVILKPINCETQSLLEDGNTHHPVWATAWKFPAEGKWTTLTKIEWETSKLGNMIPVAVFQPIELSGSMVTRCSLSNAENVRTHRFLPGDKLYIEKANDIIPFMKEHKPGCDSAQRGVYLQPNGCSCGNKNLVWEGVHLSCKSPTCSERIVKEITSWLKSIDVENFSEATVFALFTAGVLKSIKDLYTLDETKLSGIAGIGQSKIKNILSELDRTRNMTEQELIAKLGIPTVGERAIAKLGLDSIDKFMAFNDSTYAIGRQIISWKSEKANMELVKTLVENLNLKQVDKTVKSGIKVCATGKAPIKRDELIKLMEKSGKYQWIDSVGKDTELLVTDDVNGNSSKLTKAQKLGIKITTYDKFLEELK